MTMLQMRRRVWWVGLIVGVLTTGSIVSVQPFATQIQIAINQLATGIIPFTRVRLGTSRYINWGSGTDDLGYGLRDSGGQIQVKDSGGAWTAVVSGSGAPPAGSYWTRVAEAGLSNETALGTLATALVVNTTGTGVPVAYAGTSCVSQYVQVISATGIATCATVNLISETTGTLTVGRGGTGITTGTSGGVVSFTGPSTLASSGALTQNALLLGGGSSVPTALGSLGTTTTLLHGNAAGAPTFAAVNLATAEVTGILGATNGGTANAFFAVTGTSASIKTFTFPNASSTVLTSNAAVTAVQGGTGQTSYAVGDVLFADTTTTLAKLADVATGNALISGGINTAPAWGKIGLATHVTGTLSATSGGTGFAAFTTGDLFYANSGTTLALLADVAVNSFLRSGGVATAPVWSTTKWTNAATTGDLLAASATNTYSNITAVAVGQTLISQGVTTLPVWSTALRISTINLGPNLTFSNAAPTISAGFGAGAAVTAGTSAAFRVDVGAASMSGTVGLPTAATGWNCHVEDLTATLANRADARTMQISATTTTAVLENQTVSTGAAVNWGANDILAVNCVAF